MTFPNKGENIIQVEGLHALGTTTKTPIQIIDESTLYFISKGGKLYEKAKYKQFEWESKIKTANLNKKGKWCYNDYALNFDESETLDLIELTETLIAICLKM